MVQSTNGNPPRVALRVEEVQRSEDRGPTVMVAWQAPGVVAPALPSWSPMSESGQERCYGGSAGMVRSLEVKQTKSGAPRTPPLEGPFSGAAHS